MSFDKSYSRINEIMRLGYVTSFISVYHNYRLIVIQFINLLPLLVFIMLYYTFYNLYNNTDDDIDDYLVHMIRI